MLVEKLSKPVSVSTDVCAQFNPCFVALSIEIGDRKRGSPLLRERYEFRYLTSIAFGVRTAHNNNSDGMRPSSDWRASTLISCASNSKELLAKSTS